jgi:hypothetical protein
MWLSLIFIITVNGEIYLGFDNKAYPSYNECIEKSIKSKNAFIETGQVEFVAVNCQKENKT